MATIYRHGYKIKTQELADGHYRLSVAMYSMGEGYEVSDVVDEITDETLDNFLEYAEHMQ